MGKKITHFMSLQQLGHPGKIFVYSTKFEVNPTAIWVDFIAFKLI